MRWLRVTFDYNPTFPLSALGLLIGLRLLVREVGIEEPLGETLTAVGFLQAYEALLLVVGLAILWPRRVAYETTSILRVVAVVRFASPFLAIRLAAEGRLLPALLVGGGVWALMLAKALLIHRHVKLDFLPRERSYDLFLFAIAALGLPLLAERLAALTGDAISHQSARLIQLSAWWGLAALLAPLALGPEGLGEQGPLRSRRTALVWRPLTAAGMAVLLLNALWVSGGWPRLVALGPLALVGVAIACHLTRAWGGATPGWARHAPAALCALAAWSDPRTLVGPVQVLRPGVALCALVVAGALALPLIDRRVWRPGARSLAWVAVLAPLRFMGSAEQSLPYLSCLALAFLALALWRREDTQAACAALAVAVLGLLQIRAGVPVVLDSAALFGAALALAVAWRLPRGEHAPAVAHTLCLAPTALATLAAPPAGWTLAILLAAGGASSLLAWRQEHRGLRWLAFAATSAALGRRLAHGVPPGMLLVGLSFLGVPLGTWIGLRRDARERAERAALLEDPRFQDPPELDAEVASTVASPVASPALEEVHA